MSSVIRKGNELTFSGITVKAYKDASLSSTGKSKILFNDRCEVDGIKINIMAYVPVKNSADMPNSWK